MTTRFAIISAIAIYLMAISLAQGQPFNPGQPHFPKRILAILVGATTDDSIGNGVKANLVQMRSLLSQMKSKAGIDIEEFDIVGNEFNCDAIKNVLAGRKPQAGHVFRVGPEDTVLFYYAGHGYRTEPPSSPHKFPLLWCSEFTGQSPSTHPGEDINLSDIVDSLFGSNPRLVIGIADACNYWQEIPSARRGVFTISNLQNLVHLFFDYRGVLEMSASSPGQYAWYEEHTGGYFTNQLVDALRTAPPDWASVISGADKPITISADLDGHGSKKYLQNPQAETFPGDSARKLRLAGTN